MATTPSATASLACAQGPATAATTSPTAALWASSRPPAKPAATITSAAAAVAFATAAIAVAAATIAIASAARARPATRGPDRAKEPVTRRLAVGEARREGRGGVGPAWPPQENSPWRWGRPIGRSARRPRTRLGRHHPRPSL